MTDFQAELYTDVTGILAPLKTLLDQLVKQYSKLSHQLLGEREPTQYVPVIDFIRNDIYNVMKGISMINYEFADKLNDREQTRKWNERWENRRSDSEEMGEMRVMDHLDIVFQLSHSCVTSLEEVQKNLPGAQMVGGDGDEKPIDIDRGFWEKTRNLSKEGDEMAKAREARVICALQDFWLDIGRMIASLGVVEDELRRDPVH